MIMLHVGGYRPGLWAVVQWRDGLGEWHDVEGWQGILEKDWHPWYVKPKDFGSGPFRWVLYDGQDGTLIAISRYFNLPPSQGEEVQATAQIVEGYDVISAARVMRDASELDARDAACALKELGYPAPEIGQALKDEFGQTAQGISRDLRSAFPDMGFNEAEDILTQIGFEQNEAFEGILPDLLAWYDSLIEQYGPIVYFHPSEVHHPSSIEWLLDPTAERCTLRGRIDYKTYVYEEPLSASDLVDPPKMLGEVKSLWLEIPPEEAEGEEAKREEETEDPWRELTIKEMTGKEKKRQDVKRGNLASAKGYVHAVRLKDKGMTDLQFWFFYPYNGPGTMRIWAKLDLRKSIKYRFYTQTFKAGGDEEDYGNTAPLLEHEGDWEAVILRFDNATSTLRSVFMSGHGKYPEYAVDDRLEREDQHVAVYSSLNGHANFPTAGDNAEEKYNSGRKTKKLLQYVLAARQAWAWTLNWCGKGARFPAYSHYDIVAIDGEPLKVSDGELPKAPWLWFNGTWGPVRDLELTRNEKLDIIQAIFDKAKDDIANLVGSFLEKFGDALSALPFTDDELGKAFYDAGTAIVNLVFWIMGPALLDSNFRNQTSHGPTSPANKGSEWLYRHFPDEPEISSFALEWIGTRLVATVKVRSSEYLGEYPSIVYLVPEEVVSDVLQLHPPKPTLHKLPEEVLGDSSHRAYASVMSKAGDGTFVTALRFREDILDMDPLLKFSATALTYVKEEKGETDRLTEWSSEGPKQYCYSSSEPKIESFKLNWIYTHLGRPQSGEHWTGFRLEAKVKVRNQHMLHRPHFPLGAQPQIVYFVPTELVPAVTLPGQGIPSPVYFPVIGGVVIGVSSKPPPGVSGDSSYRTYSGWMEAEREARDTFTTSLLFEGKDIQDKSLLSKITVAAVTYASEGETDLHCESPSADPFSFYPDEPKIASFDLNHLQAIVNVWNWDDLMEPPHVVYSVPAELVSRVDRLYPLERELIELPEGMTVDSSQRAYMGVMRSSGSGQFGTRLRLKWNASQSVLSKVSVTVITYVSEGETDRCTRRFGE
jgi:hypothetical protein